MSDADGKSTEAACLIDSHAHLDSAYFAEGADAVLDRARRAGLVHVVVVGVGADERAAEEAVEIAARHPDVSATVGMHPHEASHLDDRLLARLAELAALPQVVAVGEVGLDYHYMNSPPEEQQQVFRQMVGLAREVRRPIVVHTREAPELTLRILAEERAAEVGGIIHCFSEDWAFARRALDLDFDVSFSGIVTYQTARRVHDVARRVPGDRLLVETDCPYLAPVPVRGKRCEPAFVVHTARRVAELRQEPFEQLAARSTANARRRLALPVGG